MQKRKMTRKTSSQLKQRMSRGMYRRNKNEMEDKLTDIWDQFDKTYYYPIPFYNHNRPFDQFLDHPTWDILENLCKKG